MADCGSFGMIVRQIWIDGVVSEDGEINRATIADAFGISIPQASLDLREYQSVNPGRLFYDHRSKVYRTVEGSTAQFNPAAHIAAVEIVNIVMDLKR